MTETEQLHKWFREIWDSREDELGNCYCFETGKEMPGWKYRSNTSCYHHVLLKSKYPEYKFLKENIVIITPDIHSLTHNNIDKTPKIKEYRDKLLTLHYENNLKD